MKEGLKTLFLTVFKLVFLLAVFQPILYQTYAFADETLEVTVSIPPLRYFVEKIVGDLVRVSIMVPPGANPAVYEPQAKQMTQLTRSKLYFAIGVPFETVWLKRFMGVNPDMKVVYLQKGIERIPMKGAISPAGGETHYRNAMDRSQQNGHRDIKDPHIWLSPPLVMMQVRNILDALQGVDPDHVTAYENNYKHFMVELIDLDLQIRGLLFGKGRRQFMTYHPSWGYFADAYGLEQIPIEIEGKEPTPKALYHLIDYAKKCGIKVVFAQPQFSTKNADMVANAIGGKVVIADPLSMDWEENLLSVAKEIKRAIGQ